MLPGPATVFANLWDQMQHVLLWKAIYITMLPGRESGSPCRCSLEW